MVGYEYEFLFTGLHAVLAVGVTVGMLIRDDVMDPCLFCALCTIWLHCSPLLLDFFYYRLNPYCNNLFYNLTYSLILNVVFLIFVTRSQAWSQWYWPITLLTMMEGGCG